MKNREGKGPSSTDLLVCFPSRAHLTLMPKSICSPARPSDTGNRHHNNHQNSHRHHHNQQSHLKKSIKRTGVTGYSSPLLWSKNKPTTLDISEPTSPKVTCAGQIKVSHKTNKCKNWQSVMEEIEKLHNKKQKKKHTWAETLGLKKEVMQFLTCLRSLRLDFRCFGSIPASDITSDDEDDDEEEDDDDFKGKHGHKEMDEDKEASRTVFSKWFMVLQEDQNKDLVKNKFQGKNDEQCAPPPNALLLMRCRSAPAKSWLEEREEQEAMEEQDEDEDEEEEEEEEHEQQQEKNEKEKRDLRFLMEEEKIREKETMQVMKYNTDFARLSTDIAKETWVVGGIKGSLSRSRSWKR
ncbi:hypothetical protein Leryth_017751 [Lithospermum erythrorhizon]|nr:hypothetical protein Leryth_017751 [Lithospermum erythrorhizon]